MNIGNEQMRRIVWIAQTENTFFESVCFVLREDADAAGGGADMLAEAERIVAEYAQRRWGARGGAKKRSFRAGLIWGAACALALSSAFCALVAIFT